MFSKYLMPFFCEIVSASIKMTRFFISYWLFMPLSLYIFGEILVY
jgi:hypothetical protein